MRISDWSSDVCSSDLAELEQESVEVTFVPDGGEESVTMTLGAYPVRLFTASGLIKNPENIRNLPGLYAMMAMGNYQVVARELYKFSTKGGMALSPMAIGMDVASGVSPERLARSEEHTSALQSLMRISYAVFCLNKKNSILLETYITRPLTRATIS